METLCLSIFLFLCGIGNFVLIIQLVKISFRSLIDETIKKEIRNDDYYKRNNI